LTTIVILNDRRYPSRPGAASFSAMLRQILIALFVVCLAAVGYSGYRIWSLWPAAPTEVVDFTPQKRAVLEKLEAEPKFRAHDYPPQPYPGIPSDDYELAAQVVDGVIIEVLRHPDGPLAAKDVAELFAKSMELTGELKTPDRDRTADYMLEIWYILGFKESTGLFTYGAGFKMPEGYGEPLPPGWTAPDQPRPIGP